MKLWGIDLGGTKIEGVVVDSSNLLSPLCRKRVSTEADQGYARILKNTQDLINDLAAQVGERPTVVGLSTCGILDPKSALMKNCNALALNGNPFPADLERSLKISAPISNDANCFALAEALLGAGKGSATVFGVILGSGVGGGLVVDGKIIRGAHGIAGEWGHNVLVENGPNCYCGKSGCVESIISGPALERYYKEISGGKALKLKEIEDLATSSADEAAVQTIDRFVTYFGKAIAYVINIFDPDSIVLGGGASKTSALYERGLSEAQKYVFNDYLNTKLVQHELGDSAGVFGAILLAQARMK